MNESSLDVIAKDNTVTKQPAENATNLGIHPSLLGDYFIAIVCVFCFVFGILGNSIALRFFFSQRKDLPTLLYTAIAIIDTLSCSTILPVAVCYFHKRDAKWFNNAIFCYGWGILWAVIPFMSVFLVAVLSITRTISLLNPLGVIDKGWVKGIILTYTTYLVLWSTIPVVFRYGRFKYTPSDVYCWESTEEGWYSNIEIVNGATLLAFPIIPILISCVISIYSVLSSLRISKLSRSVRHMKLEATITIIIITVVYIFLNIPIFIIWVLYIYDKFTVRKTVILYYYSWSVCYVVSVAVNATLNPLIYFFRMEKFRVSTRRTFNRKMSTAHELGRVSSIRRRKVSRDVYSCVCLKPNGTLGIPMQRRITRIEPPLRSTALLV